MTIIMVFHVIDFSNFNIYYPNLHHFHFTQFKNLGSYNRFIEPIENEQIGSNVVL